MSFFFPCIFLCASPTRSLTKIIMSHCRLMSTTPSLRLLSITMPTPFLVVVVPVYHSLKPVSDMACYHMEFISIRMARILVGSPKN
jgi:hypothetical protein